MNHRFTVSDYNPPRSVVVSKVVVASHGNIKTCVEQLLGLDAKVDRGMIHSWTYSNGDVRYTFQPSKEPK